MDDARRASAAGLCLLMLFSGSALARQANYDRHVVFDYSADSHAYYYSHATVTRPSELEIADARLPVETHNCRTPPNCLRLRYASHTGGDWHVGLEPAKSRYGVDFSGDALALWVYSEFAIDADAAPRIAVTDTSGRSTPAIELTTGIARIPARQWIRISLPFTAFRPDFGLTSSTPADMLHPATISFYQGLDDGKAHTLYVDEVRIEDAQPASDAPAAAHRAQCTRLRSAHRHQLAGRRVARCRLLQGVSVTGRRILAGHWHAEGSHPPLHGFPGCQWPLRELSRDGGERSRAGVGGIRDRLGADA